MSSSAQYFVRLAWRTLISKPGVMNDELWRGLLPTIMPATGSIYHYTSPSGLLGLVENHELWATEATGMNDLGEVRQGWDFIRSWVRGQPRDEVHR